MSAYPTQKLTELAFPAKKENPNFYDLNHSEIWFVIYIIFQCVSSIYSFSLQYHFVLNEMAYCASKRVQSPFGKPLLPDSSLSRQ